MLNLNEILISKGIYVLKEKGKVNTPQVYEIPAFVSQ